MNKETKIKYLITKTCLRLKINMKLRIYFIYNNRNLILHMDYQEIKQFAISELIKNRGIYTLQTLKKLQSQFVQKLFNDEIVSNLNVELLRELKMLLYSYEVLTVQISQQFEFLDMREFGQSIAKMFYQLIQIIRFLVRKYASLQRTSRIQKTNPIIINKDQVLQEKQLDQFSLKKLKFEQIEKDRFFIQNAQNFINKFHESNEYLQNLQKQLIDKKQAVLNINYSKTQGILKETLNVLVNHNKYTNNYIKATQQNIRQEKHLFQINPEYFYKLMNLSRQQAFSKTKNTFLNLKQKIKCQQIQKYENKKHFADKNIQANVGVESGEIVIRKDLQKKKMMEKLTNSIRQNTILKQRNQQLQINLQSKNIEILNLQTEIKRLQSNLVSLNYEIQRYKEETELKIQSIKQKYEANQFKTIEQIQTPIMDKSNILKTRARKKKKKTIFNYNIKLQQIQQVNFEQYNQVIQIILFPVTDDKKNCLNKSTDTHQIQRNLIMINSEATSTRQITNYAQKINKKQCCNQQIQVYEAQLPADQILANQNIIDQNIQNNCIDKQDLPHLQQQKLEQKQIELINFMKKSEKSNRIREFNKKLKSSLNSMNGTPPRSSLKIEVQKVQSGISLKTAKDKEQENKSVKLITIMSTRKQEDKKLQYLQKKNINFTKDDYDLFGGEQYAKNLQSIRINEYKNLKRNSNSTVKDSQVDKKNTLILNNAKWRENNEIELQLENLITNFYKFMKLLKSVNPKKYANIRNYLRYPYSLIKLQKNSIWEKSNQEQFDVGYLQLHKILKRIFKLHEKCYQNVQNNYKYCHHFSTFFVKIGFYPPLN